MSNPIQDFLRALARSPLELLRVLVHIVLFILWALIMLFKALFCRKKKPRRPCPGDVPQHVKRRPDPCIYSQTYLMEQGLPVTWNNPDIQLTELDGTPVSSSSLQPNHDYRVVGQISNASFDAALGVSVRCIFRNWGVGGNFVPVQMDAGGNEIVNFVHIGPYGQEESVFRWRTPAQVGHYCLKVICAHPDDLNTSNNTGQENTNVVEAVAGGSATERMQVANPTQRDARMQFRIDTYEIPEREWTMNLKTTRIPLGDRPVLGGDAKESINFAARTRRWVLARRHIYYQFWQYLGRGELFAEQRKARTSLPDGWKLEINNAGPESGIDLGPREIRNVDVKVTIPAGAQPDTVVPINISAWDATLGPLGGVTLAVRVRERS